jgi:hypothetical protein
LASERGGMMSKTHILVDYLPKKSCDCPFSYYEKEFDYGYVCRLDKNEDTCLLELDKPCDKLRNAYTCHNYKDEVVFGCIV